MKINLQLPLNSVLHCHCSPYVISASFQVILKDLEVLAEIASSPAGQTEGHGPYEGSDMQSSQSELHVPIKPSQLSTSGKCMLHLANSDLTC